MASHKSACGLIFLVVVVVASASLSLAYSDAGGLALCLKQCGSPECKARCVDTYYKGEIKANYDEAAIALRQGVCRRGCYIAGGSTSDILECLDDCTSMYYADRSEQEEQY